MVIMDIMFTHSLTKITCDNAYPTYIFNVYVSIVRGYLEAFCPARRS